MKSLRPGTKRSKNSACGYYYRLEKCQLGKQKKPSGTKMKEEMFFLKESSD